MRILTVLACITLYSFGLSQMRPLPAQLCMADEPDIHQKLHDEIQDAFGDGAQAKRKDAETKARLDKIVSDMDWIDKWRLEKDKSALYSMEMLSLQSQIKDMEYERHIEKKIIGIAGLLCFVSGNETIKNVGLVSLFCYSIW